MKRTRQLAIATLLSATLSTAQAQLNGSGYYRLLNEETGRYLTIANDKVGSSMEAAFTALVTVKGFDNVVDNPASILYLRSEGGNEYDMVAQGVDTYQLTTGYHFKISNAASNTYNIYVGWMFINYYLGDNVMDGSIISQADIDGTARKWYILPVNTSDNQYFGFKPEVQDDNNGYYYTTCYAAFPFRPVDDVKVFYVDEIKDNYALMREITGDVPAATPVIIRCPSESPSGNRVMPLTTSPEAISGNLLRGVYFDNITTANPNYTKYDKKTMRVIGKTSNGSAGMSIADIFRLPANKAYLPVSEGEASQLTLITHEDYDKQITPEEQSIADIGARDTFYDVYSLSGQLVARQKTIWELTEGVYLLKSNMGSRTTVKVIIPSK